MHFTRTPEQLSFADAVAALVRRTGGASQVRAAAEYGQATRSVSWAGLGNVGLLALLAPEDLGGGGTEIELVIGLEELGRAAAPGPLVEHSAVAIPLLAAVAPGRLDLALKCEEVLTASDTTLVPYADGATVAIIIEPDRVLEIALDDTALRTAIDPARHVAEIAVRDAVVLAEGPQIAHHYARARDRGAVGTSALLVGLAAGAVDLTVAYDRIRHQFGVPVGSFQAVKHQLANAHVAVEFARPLVEAAAWALSVEDDDASRLCSMAKVMSNKAARLAAKTALQCHGAIGYTMESELHPYLVRIWSLLNAWGGSDVHRDRIATTLSVGPTVHSA